MGKVFVMIFTGIIVSFYYFPFEFSFLPGINTKMGLAVVGIVLAMLNLLRKREFCFPYNLVKIVAFAVLVSIIGVIAVTINNTQDYAYATYFVSMMVWLSAAYTVCTLINKVHSGLTIENVTLYITCVCVVQCLLALLIDSNVALKNLVDTYIMQDQEFLSKVGRIYGIGASLDTAGVRFSICLILLMYWINTYKAKLTSIQLSLAMIAYIIIVVVGNMIARTTIVGLGLSLLYAFSTFKPQEVSRAFLRFSRVFAIVLIVVIPFSLFLYNNNQQFYELSRFAFEGFFNWAERGEWYISSNERLKAMIVFPESVKTWIIGDGYFANPYNTDPTYVGPYIGGYYMGTDIGYLRFIFYFGLIGLVSFSYFFIVIARECARVLPNYRQLILFIFILGFVIWVKVATDVFLIFALFICIGNIQTEITESQLVAES